MSKKKLFDFGGKSEVAETDPAPAETEAEAPEAAPIEDVGTAILTAPKAVEAAKAKAADPVVAVDTYRIDRRCVFCKDGQVFTLEAGSVVSTQTHDIGELGRQGVPLVPCAPPQAKVDEYGRVVGAAESR